MNNTNQSEISSESHRARPTWLTGPMLDEMRRLKGTDIGNMSHDGGCCRDIFTLSFGEAGAVWVNGVGFGPGSNQWLTPSGHEALAAIEAEEPR